MRILKVTYKNARRINLTVLTVVGLVLIFFLLLQFLQTRAHAIEIRIHRTQEIFFNTLARNYLKAGYLFLNVKEHGSLAEVQELLIENNRLLHQFQQYFSKVRSENKHDIFAILHRQTEIYKKTNNMMFQLLPEIEKGDQRIRTLASLYEENSKAHAYTKEHLVKTKDLFTSELSRTVSETQTAALEMQQLLNQEEDADMQSIQRRLQWLLGLASGLFLLSLFLAFLSNRALRDPVRKLVESADTISRGNFDHAVVLNETGELGRLGSAIESMRLNIKKLLLREKDLTKQAEQAFEREQDKTKALEAEIMQRRAAEEKYSHLSYHDALTDLPNRRQFDEVLKREFSKAKQLELSLAVLFLDLDDFKNINEVYGHIVGDQILKQVSERLTSSLHKEDFVARMGGDEFAIIIVGFKEAYLLSRLAKRLISLFEKPFAIDGLSLKVSTSLGLATFPESGESAGDLVQHAEVALYHAKQLGRNNFQYYVEELNEKQERRFFIENQFSSALQNDEFYLVYQPVINHETGKVRAVETLVRWRNSELGELSPAEFIPIAEASGNIVKLGGWILRRALDDLARWSKLGYSALKVCVNLSPIQIIQRDFTKEVAGELEKRGLNGSSVGFEVTETALMTYLDELSAVIKELSEQGHEILIDDFGTGYSSLNRLMTLNVTTLKIDQSFIEKMVQNDQALMIVKSIVALANNLHLNLIAEGVETKEEERLIKSMDCLFLQGFLYCKPIVFDQMTEYLKEHGVGE